MYICGVYKNRNLFVAQTCQDEEKERFVQVILADAQKQNKEIDIEYLTDEEYSARFEPTQ